MIISCFFFSLKRSAFDSKNQLNLKFICVVFSCIKVRKIIETNFEKEMNHSIKIESDIICKYGSNKANRTNKRLYDCTIVIFRSIRFL